MYEEGYILGIDRDDKLEESGLLPYNTHYPIELESTTPAESDVNDTVKTLRPQ